MMPRRLLHRALLLSILGLVCLEGLEAQTADIYGVVTDSLTRQRIPFANVTVLATTRGAASNNLGFYLIPKLPPGTYEVAASVIGYARVVHRVSLRAGQSLELNFQLPPAAVEYQEVIVSAPARRLETQISTSVHVLERQELKQIPMAAQQDLLQALKILPGFVSTSDVSSRFYVRGGAGDQNLFLYDGIRVYYPFHALGIFSVFNPNVVDNVEVWTGAFPPEYGGRLSSVVSVTSRDGRADRISGSANANFLSSEVQLEGPVFENTTWLVDARKSLSSRTFSNIVGQNVPLAFYDATVKVSAQPSGVQKFDATFLTSGDNLLAASPEEPNYRWRNNGFAISASGLPTERVFTQWLIYGSLYSAERDAKKSETVTPASTSVKHYGLRAAATLYTNPQDLYFIGFEFGLLSPDYIFVNRLGNRQELSSSILEASAWARYQANFGRLLLDGGLHLELGSLFEGGDLGRDLQPRFNASYLVWGNWRAKVSLGRFTQRILTVGNEDDVISIFDAWIRVPENIPPEQADHYVLGLTGNVTELTSLNIESYYKHYGSLVVYNRDKLYPTDPDYIQGRGSSYGVELMLRSKLSFLDLYGAYSLSWTKIDNQGLVYFPRYDRRHHVNLMVVAHPSKGLNATLRWEYGSGFPFSQTVGYFDRLKLDNALPGEFELETGSPFVMLGSKNAARLPAYHRLDASVAYDFRFVGLDVSLGADVLNVYDNKNIFYFDRITGQRVNMLSFYPSASLTVKY
jgi:hypothetical protein